MRPRVVAPPGACDCHMHFFDSRYPLWDQPNFERDVDEGRFYLPDAEEEKRETINIARII